MKNLLPKLIILACPGLGLADDLLTQYRLGSAALALAFASSQIVWATFALAAGALGHWREAVLSAAGALLFWLLPLLCGFLPAWVRARRQPRR